MADLINNKLESRNQRIQAQYSAKEVVSQVFTSETSRSSFIDALIELNNMSASIKVGGRRLRELAGCEIIDLSKHIVYDAYELSFDGVAKIRLGPLIKILKEYPESRMIKPDLDFFICNITTDEIVKIFTDKGFDVSVQKNATGGVWVVDVVGENGIATFIDVDKSWQTGNAWPKYGVLANFQVNPDPYFNLNIESERLYSHPLDIPDLHKMDALAPQRVAGVGRAFLWSLTSSNPDKLAIELPPIELHKYFFETISYLPMLIYDIEQNPNLMRLYKGGLRDMALALRIIVLSDWQGMVEEFGYSQSRANFFGYIQTLWQAQLWKMNEYIRHQSKNSTEG